MRFFGLFALLRLCFAFALGVLSLSAQAGYTAGGPLKELNIGIIKAPGSMPAAVADLLRNYQNAYLDEIAKHTHWNFEFYYVSRPEGLKMLREGKIDLLTPLCKPDPAAFAETSAAAEFIYSTGFSGYGMLSLYALSANREINPENQQYMNGARIGARDHQENLRKIRHYIAVNHWQSELRVFPDSASLFAALRNGEIEAAIDDGTHVAPDVRHVDCVNLISMQFAALSKNRPLMDAWNAAVMEIETTNPTFETFLESEYIDPALAAIARLNSEQHELLRRSRALKVVFTREVRPLVYRDLAKKRITGIYPGIMDLVAEKLGLKFEYSLNSELEGHALFERGLADLIVSPYHEKLQKLGIYFTNDLTRETFVAVSPNKVGGGGFIRVSLPKIFEGSAEYIGRRHPNWAMQIADTPRKSIEAVEAGDADVALIPLSVYRQQNYEFQYPLFSIIEGMTVNLPLEIAVGSNLPDAMRLALNVAILHLERSQIEIVQNNFMTPAMSLAYFVKRYPLFVFIITVATLMAVCLLLVTMWRVRIQHLANARLNEKNAELEAAIQKANSMRVSRDKYRSRAQIDPMTGLYNKMTFGHLAREMIQDRAPEIRQGLCIIDIDHFKEINDTYGHSVGDKILVNVSRVLRECFRSTDLIGRFGGDEFVVFMPMTEQPLPFARLAAEISRGAQFLLLPYGGDRLTLSLGFAVAPDDADTYENLFQAADGALYQAKIKRDGYCISGYPPVNHQA